MAETPPFADVAIIGLGLIGSSVARAVRAAMPDVRLTGYDANANHRAQARALQLADALPDTPQEAVETADLVIFCVPVGAMGGAAAALRDHLKPNALISDVGSSKAYVLAELQAALPDHAIIPAHPVAGTERSGPDAGFASLFQNRWCILTPPADANPTHVADITRFWQALGANVEQMDPQHHDLVLAVTSHLPHLIAYTIVGTASDLESVTRSDVIKYYAGGFRGFTLPIRQCGAMSFCRTKTPCWKCSSAFQRI